MIDSVDIEQNINEILPCLFDKLPNNSLFVMGEWNIIVEKINEIVVLSITPVKDFQISKLISGKPQSFTFCSLIFILTFVKNSKI